MMSDRSRNFHPVGFYTCGQAKYHQLQQSIYSFEKVLICPQITSVSSRLDLYRNYFLQ